MILRRSWVASLQCRAGTARHVDLDTAHHLLGSRLRGVELFSRSRRQMLLKGHRVRVEDALADGTGLSVRLRVSGSLREATDLVHESRVGLLRVGLLSSQVLS